MKLDQLKELIATAAIEVFARRQGLILTAAGFLVTVASGGLGGTTHGHGLAVTGIG